MVDITSKFRVAKRNERYRRMLAALTAIKAEPDISDQVRTLVDQGLDEDFDPASLPVTKDGRSARASQTSKPRRVSDRADIYRFVAFSTEAKRPCGHGRTKNAALADAESNHKPLSKKDRYEILEFDIEAGETVFFNATPLSKARRLAMSQPLEASEPDVPRKTRAKAIAVGDSVIKG